MQVPGIAHAATDCDGRFSWQAIASAIRTVILRQGQRRLIAWHRALILSTKCSVMAVAAVLHVLRLSPVGLQTCCRRQAAGWTGNQGCQVHTLESSSA